MNRDPLIRKWLSILTGFQILSWVLCIFNVWNYNQVDTLGHLSGASSLLKVGFHGFNDQFFTGIVQNLFYPPLHDFILSLILRTGLAPILSLKILESFIAAGFLLSVRFVVRHPKGWIEAFLYVFISAWIYRARFPSLDFQGLGFVDFFVIGLLPQFLGAILFFFILNEEQREDLRPRRLIAFLSLAILTHLIMGLCAILTLSFELIYRRPRDRRLLAFVLAGSFFLTAFWWFPFLAAKPILVSNTVSTPFSFSYLAGLILFGLADHQWVKRQKYFILATLLYLPILLYSLSSKIPLPAFHYYRLAIVSAIFLILQGGKSLFAAETHLKRGLLIGSLVLATFGSFSFPKLNTPGESLAPPLAQSLEDPLIKNPNPDFRWWTAGPYRSFDFALDSSLALEFENFKSVKGLWWESHRDHLLVNSYIATLISSPVVLDHFYYYDLSCPVLKCLLGEFSKTFAVRGVLLSLEEMNFGTVPRNRPCLDSLASGGGKSEALHFDGYPFRSIYFAPSPENSLIESISSDQLTLSSDRGPFGFAQPLQFAGQTCEKPGATGIRRIMVWPGEPLSHFQVPETPIPPHPFTSERLKAGAYRIIPTTPGPGLYLFKLSPFPGLKVTNDRGDVLPLVATNPGFVVKAAEPFQIEYGPSTADRIGLGTTLFAMSFIAFSFLLKKWNN
jgi:hypothetical protein